MTPADLVAHLSYKPGWVFKIGGPLNSMLCVFATTPDSSNPARSRTTQHQFTLPPLGTDLVRWALDRLLEIEQHEACEFFTVNGSRPFFPNHQDEGSPYDLVDRRTHAPQ